MVIGCWDRKRWQEEGEGEGAEKKWLLGMESPPNSGNSKEKEGLGENWV